ncbi:MAG: hypothetical protein COU07_04115 [Candidatus Harrisonbacteria bacterium CG10_big_fil_rev_8_21_14_0_10_40_38]|uniref:SIMPL domain-containing protein n=1 Tax=Candidatus Harrisonbacteria bacterium CG10_big_fil_rev_8_21_14_0_10_40_38 TaxID=1974583 RepID=A0A2H0UR00_9BACT|nr:MAG: hypothetical protein COU07_04115 [Candidatus Harrisonbacteria bacterium CG10_big_fil_rev_8_21_14_0_10_40_38]
MPNNNNFSQKWFWILLNSFLVVAIAFGIKVLFFSSFFSPLRTVSVSAEGRAIVAPDIAEIYFSVVSEGKDPKVVQESNTKKMNDAIDFVKSQGIPAVDIKTSNYSLIPRYDYNPRPDLYPTKTEQIIGYVLTQTVNVTVRDLEKTGAILGGLPSHGINQIENVSYMVDDPDAFLADARTEAFTKARAKADAMAKANRAKIRRVVTFGESTGGYPIFYKGEAYGRGGATDVASVPAPQIEPGTDEITVQVSVTYELW